jgi:hypothetical protein
MRIKSRHLEFEMLQLFPFQNSSEIVHTKNVVERSVLCGGGDAQAAQESELASSASVKLEKRDRIFAISLCCSRRGLIFHVASAKGKQRRPASSQ